MSPAHSSPTHSSSSIRVLIVDDSVTVRQLVVDALSTDPELQVVGTAANGVLALSMLARTQPDCIVLDLDMPVMDGLEFLQRLRAGYPRLPVIVFSTLTTHGAESTLAAMWNGASDYVAKPQAGDYDSALRQTRAELVYRIKAFAHRSRSAPSAPSASASRTSAGRAGQSGAAPVQPFHATPATPAVRASLVAIGASTGGPRALVDILSAMPGDLEAPVLVVQHMPPLFTRHFADGLAAQCELVVREAEHGVVLEPGTVWIAPGDHHMTISRDGAMVRVWLDKDPHENACRPSVDPMLRSVARVHGAGALAVILTGMGSDGMLGCRAIREAHGQVVAQDEATSVVWGMPGSVVRAELAQAVLPVESIASEIVQRVRRNTSRRAA
ncbi:MAG: chemotaxis response regulator protein-glutamate methylesterase [Candidatus Eisenbacteria bacterium]